MSFFDDAYLGQPPWDIGREQGAFRRMLEKQLFNSPIMDIGCGTGSNSLYFASKGYSVLGIDASPNAIAKAKQKAKASNLEGKAHFMTYNLFNLQNIGQSFNTIIDSGVFHMFSRNDRQSYEKNVKKILNKDGRILILAFSYLEPLGIGPHQRLQKEDYLDIFKDGWKIESFTDDVFETTIRTDHPKGLLTTIRKL